MFGRLEKAGRTPIEIITATSYLSDRVEFAIRHSKLPGTRWLIRLGASVLADGKPGWLAHSGGTDERTTEGWQVLRMD